MEPPKSRDTYRLLVQAGVISEANVPYSVFVKGMADPSVRANIHKIARDKGVVTETNVDTWAARAIPDIYKPEVKKKNLEPSDGGVSLSNVQSKQPYENTTNTSNATPQQTNVYSGVVDQPTQNPKVASPTSGASYNPKPQPQQFNYETDPYGLNTSFKGFVTDSNTPRQQIETRQAVEQRKREAVLADAEAIVNGTKPKPAMPLPDLSTVTEKEIAVASKNGIRLNEQWTEFQAKEVFKQHSDRVQAVSLALDDAYRQLPDVETYTKQAAQYAKLQQEFDAIRETNPTRARAIAQEAERIIPALVAYQNTPQFKKYAQLASKYEEERARYEALKNDPRMALTNAMQEEYKAAQQRADKYAQEHPILATLGQGAAGFVGRLESFATSVISLPFMATDAIGLTSGTITKTLSSESEQFQKTVLPSPSAVNTGSVYNYVTIPGIDGRIVVDGQNKIKSIVNDSGYEVSATEEQIQFIQSQIDKEKPKAQRGYSPMAGLLSTSRTVGDIGATMAISRGIGGLASGTRVAGAVLPGSVGNAALRKDVLSTAVNGTAMVGDAYRQAISEFGNTPEGRKKAAQYALALSYTTSALTSRIGIEDALLANPKVALSAVPTSSLSVLMKFGPAKAAQFAAAKIAANVSSETAEEMIIEPFVESAYKSGFDMKQDKRSTEDLINDFITVGFSSALLSGGQIAANRGRTPEYETFKINSYLALGQRLIEIANTPNSTSQNFAGELLDIMKTKGVLRTDILDGKQSEQVQREYLINYIESAAQAYTLINNNLDALTEAEVHAIGRDALLAAESSLKIPQGDRDYNNTLQSKVAYDQRNRAHARVLDVIETAKARQAVADQEYVPVQSKLRGWAISNYGEFLKDEEGNDFFYKSEADARAAIDNIKSRTGAVIQSPTQSSTASPTADTPQPASGTAPVPTAPAESKDDTTLDSDEELPPIPTDKPFIGLKTFEAPPDYGVEAAEQEDGTVLIKVNDRSKMPTPFYNEIRLNSVEAINNEDGTTSYRVTKEAAISLQSSYEFNVNAPVTSTTTTTQTTPVTPTTGNPVIPEATPPITTVPPTGSVTTPGESLPTVEPTTGQPTEPTPQPTTPTPTANTSDVDKDVVPVDANGNPIFGNPLFREILNKPKTTGRATTKYLPNGTTIKGRYHIVSARDVVNSHNPEDFSQNKRFPTTELGDTKNTRDYANDKAAQQVADARAKDFDGQAVNDAPVVDRHGVVLSGNGRTIARMRAAAQGTDTKYMEALRAELEALGFPPDAIDGIDAPFLVFVPDNDFEYTPAVFDMFNAEDKFQPSDLDEATKLSAVLDREKRRKIASLARNNPDRSGSRKKAQQFASSFLRLLKELNLFNVNRLGELYNTTEKILQQRGDDFADLIYLAAALPQKSIRKIFSSALLKGLRARLTSDEIVVLLIENATLPSDKSFFNLLDKAIELIAKSKYTDGDVGSYLGEMLLFSSDSDKFTYEEAMLAVILDDSRGTALTRTQLATVLSDYFQEAHRPADMFGNENTRTRLLEDAYNRKRDMLAKQRAEDNNKTKLLMPLEQLKSLVENRTKQAINIDATSDDKIDVKNKSDLYRAYRKQYGMSVGKAVVAVMITDNMIGNMANRLNITKAEAYKKFTFQSSKAKRPQGTNGKQSSDIPTSNKLLSTRGTSTADTDKGLMIIAENAEGRLLLNEYAEGRRGVIPVEVGDDYVIIPKTKRSKDWSEDERKAVEDTINKVKDAQAEQDIVKRHEALVEALPFLKEQPINGYKVSEELLLMPDSWGVDDNGKVVLIEDAAVRLDSHNKAGDTPTLFQVNDKGEPTGEITIMPDGRIVIEAMTGADMSTVMHEMAHAFETVLTDKEKSEIAKWAGHKTYNAKTSEKFARGFEKWLRDGKPQKVKMIELFNKAANFFRQMYAILKGTPISGITLNPQMEAIYKKIADGDNDSFYKAFDEIGLSEEARRAAEIELGLTQVVDTSGIRPTDLADIEPITEAVEPEIDVEPTTTQEPTDTEPITPTDTQTVTTPTDVETPTEAYQRLLDKADEAAKARQAFADKLTAAVERQRLPLASLFNTESLDKAFRSYFIDKILKHIDKIGAKLVAEGRVKSMAQFYTTLPDIVSLNKVAANGMVEFEGWAGDIANIHERFNMNDPLNARLFLGVNSAKNMGDLMDEISKAEAAGWTPDRNYYGEKFNYSAQLGTWWNKETLEFTDEQVKEIGKRLADMYKSGKKETTIGAVLGDTHPLFDSYPKLRTIPVSLITNFDVNYGGRAKTTKDEEQIGKIIINTAQKSSNHNDNLGTTFLHEVQHVIQFSEGVGFTKYSNDKRAVKYLKSLRDKHKETVRKALSNKNYKVAPPTENETPEQKKERIEKEIVVAIIRSEFSENILVEYAQFIESQTTQGQKSDNAKLRALAPYMGFIAEQSKGKDNDSSKAVAIGAKPSTATAETIPMSLDAALSRIIISGSPANINTNLRNLDKVLEQYFNEVVSQPTETSLVETIDIANAEASLADAKKQGISVAEWARENPDKAIDLIVDSLIKGEQGSEQGKEIREGLIAAVATSQSDEVRNNLPIALEADDIAREIDEISDGGDVTMNSPSLPPATFTEHYEPPKSYRERIRNLARWFVFKRPYLPTKNADATYVPEKVTWLERTFFDRLSILKGAIREAALRSGNPDAAKHSETNANTRKRLQAGRVEARNNALRRWFMGEDGRKFGGKKRAKDSWVARITGLTKSTFEQVSDYMHARAAISVNAQMRELSDLRLLATKSKMNAQAIGLELEAQDNRAKAAAARTQVVTNQNIISAITAERKILEKNIRNAGNTPGVTIADVKKWQDRIADINKEILNLRKVNRTLRASAKSLIADADVLDNQAQDIKTEAIRIETEYNNAVIDLSALAQDRDDAAMRSKQALLQGNIEEAEKHAADYRAINKAIDAIEDNLTITPIVCGSGMTDKTAMAIQDDMTRNLSPEDRQKLQDLEDEFRNNTSIARIHKLYDSGFISAEDRDAILSGRKEVPMQFQAEAIARTTMSLAQPDDQLLLMDLLTTPIENYVPLTVNSFAYRGKQKHVGALGSAASYRLPERVGSNKYGMMERDNPLVNAVNQTASTNSIAESNAVKRLFAEQTLQAFQGWHKYKFTKSPYGEMRLTMQNDYEDMSKVDHNSQHIIENSITWWEDGNMYALYIPPLENYKKDTRTTHPLVEVFKPKPTRDPQILQEIIVRMFNSFGGFFRFTMTTMSLDFLATNPQRDAQSISSNLSNLDLRDENGKPINRWKIRASIYSKIPKSAIAIAQFNRGDDTSTSAAMTYWQEAVRNGVPMTWSQDGNRVEINERLLAEARKFENGKRVISKGEFTREVGETIINTIAFASDVTENMTRLATYWALREAGVSEAEAAIIAKEITVNFEAGGVLSKAINPFYTFANVQFVSAARQMAAFCTKAGLKYAGGCIAAGFALAALNSMWAGDEDDKHRYNQYKMKKKILIPNVISYFTGVGDPNTPLMISRNYTIFGSFFYLGEMLYDSLVDKKITTWEVATNFMANLWENVVPFFKSTVLSTYFPTLIQPFAAIVENKKYDGTPITYGKELLKDYEIWEQTSKNTNPFYIALSKEMAENKAIPDALKLRPSELKYIFKHFLGGGPAQFQEIAAGIVSAATDKEPPAWTGLKEPKKLHEMPFIRTFYDDQKRKDHHDAFEANDDLKKFVNGDKEITAKRLEFIVKLSKDKPLMDKVPKAVRADFHKNLKEALIVQKAVEKGDPALIEATRQKLKKVRKGFEAYSD